MKRSGQDFDRDKKGEEIRSKERETDVWRRNKEKKKEGKKNRQGEINNKEEVSRRKGEGEKIK